MATVTLDLDGIPRKVDRIKSDDGLGLFMATEAMRGMSPYVPFRNATSTLPRRPSRSR